MDNNTFALKGVQLSEPRIARGFGKDVYVYRAESTSNPEYTDLEFVIYIPVDTPVIWHDLEQPDRDSKTKRKSKSDELQPQEEDPNHPSMETETPKRKSTEGKKNKSSQEEYPYMETENEREKKSFPEDRKPKRSTLTSIEKERLNQMIDEVEMRDSGESQRRRPSSKGEDLSNKGSKDSPVIIPKKAKSVQFSNATK